MEQTLRDSDAIDCIYNFLIQCDDYRGLPRKELRQLIKQAIVSNVVIVEIMAQVDFLIETK